MTLSRDLQRGNNTTDYFQATQSRPRRRKAPVVTSGAGRGRSSGRKNTRPSVGANGMPMYGWGFGHGGAPGAQVAQNQAKWFLAEQLGQGPGEDPFGGATLAELMLGGRNPADSGPSSGRNRSGGSGGGGGVGRANALKAILDQINAASKGYGDREKSLKTLRDDQSKKIAGIIKELGGVRNTTRSATQASYKGTDEQMQRLAAEAAGLIGQRDAGANQALEAYGIAPSVGGNADPLNRMMLAARMQNTQLGGAADAMYANRDNVWNGMNADTTLAAQRQYEMMMAQLQAQKQQELAALNAQKAQIAMGG